MNRSKVIFILLFIFLLIPARVAHTLTLKVKPSSVDMGIIVADDYENGRITKKRANRLRIKNPEVAWKVMVRTDDSNMGVVGSYTKSLSDFKWKAVGDYATQTSYTSITNYDVETGRGPEAVGSTLVVRIHFRILLSWAQDIPGDYNLTLVYTLTTQ